MTTLLIATHTDGTRRTCDARCYKALGGRCTCVCGGAHHGIGLVNALTKLRQNMDSREPLYGAEWSCNVLPFQPELNPNSVAGEPTTKSHLQPSSTVTTMEQTRRPHKEVQ